MTLQYRDPDGELLYIESTDALMAECCCGEPSNTDGDGTIDNFFADIRNNCAQVVAAGTVWEWSGIGNPGSVPADAQAAWHFVSGSAIGPPWPPEKMALYLWKTAGGTWEYAVWLYWGWANYWDSGSGAADFDTYPTGAITPTMQTHQLNSPGGQTFKVRFNGSSC